MNSAANFARSTQEVDRLVLKTMGIDSPKAQILAAQPRVLVNALRTTRSTSKIDANRKRTVLQARCYR
jgi:hypothetical protein